MSLPNEADALKASAGTPVLHITRIAALDKKPVVMEETLIRGDALEAAYGLIVTKSRTARLSPPQYGERSKHRQPEKGSRMTDYIQVVTTAVSQKDAYELAHALVGHGLAADVQISGPMVSIYKSESAVVEDQHWHLTVRTTVHRYPALQQRILDHTGDETTNIVIVPLDGGNTRYLNWIDQQVEA
ncbi:divalent cation tolerance protein CutA [Streptosporangiaceae bacterium NEAU-GS5]|nr:divalent cation tolerance protein CutA [Streptosporangiaceae bacterium NEAU-GS5]